MTSWPWMKGINVALADPPIAPESDYDVRPAVVDLLTKYRSKVDEIQAQLESDPLFDKTKHDDLWVLRFHLSHKKNLSQAVKAAKHTLEFRHQYNLDDQDLRDYPPYASLWDDVKIWFQFTNNNSRHTIPNKQRGVIVYINPKGIDFHGMDENLNDQQLLMAHMYIMEWTHQWLDYVTRTTGRLTKSIRVLDLKNMGREGLNMRFNKRYSAITDDMEDIYPQLLESAYFCDPVTWMKLLWDVFRPLLPKRVVTKVDFIVPAKNVKERKRLFQHISEEDLPTNLGGKNSVPWQQLL